MRVIPTMFLSPRKLQITEEVDPKMDENSTNLEGRRKNLENLQSSAGHLGIDIFSSTIVDEKIRGGFHKSIKEVSLQLDYAVVIGICLSASILETVKVAPTWTYYYHYRIVNFALDQAALFISGECGRMGYSALPIPASQIMDWNRLSGHLSHRELGASAGLGWWGRNNLLVNPEHGAHIRLATVLTNMPLPDMGEDREMPGCGDCYKCIDVCPVGAIHEEPEDFNLDKCTAQLRRFSKSEKLNTMICGLCVKVCDGTF